MRRIDRGVCGRGEKREAEGGVSVVSTLLPFHYPRPQLSEASQLNHRCTSTYTNARRPSLKRGRPRLL
eukprot:scaffold46832_cov39-Phaeocystis_antarctica.AAC.1